jgi:tRNA-2-methylthio-N6-dimethylallyladenosine synthase
VLCDHVHLPVQSGSDRVLAAMDRLYTRDDYMRCIEWINHARRKISITTDIIVGFPGETEADFQATLDLLDEVRYDSLFSFKYSPRPNTSALAMEDKVPEEEKTRRLMILQEKQRAIQIRRNSELIGSVQEVLVEGRNVATGQWIGRTSSNRTLNFTSPETDASALTGTYLPVLVTRAGPNSLVGQSAAVV